MAELIEATEQPFIQKIVDVVVPRTVFGRVCLLSKWRPAMRRVVSLFLPAWSTDRLRRILGGAAPPAEAPLALGGAAGRST